MVWDDSEPYHGFSQTTGETYLPFSSENTVSVASAVKDENSLYSFICRLIALRKKIKDLKDPLEWIRVEGRVLTFGRKKYELIVNMSDSECPFVIVGKKVFSSTEFEGDIPPVTAVLVKKDE